MIQPPTPRERAALDLLAARALVESRGLRMSAVAEILRDRLADSYAENIRQADRIKRLERELRRGAAPANPKAAKEGKDARS